MTSAPVLLPAPQDRARLRRAKRGATGLLAGTAGVFLATFALPDSTAVGFLRAAAEAGTVGGLADWFAVTALFRHPLRVPVPHTALVPRKKDELATKLGEFVTGNFLTADVVAGQLVETRVVSRVAGRLAEPGAARLVAHELATAVTAGLDLLDEPRLTAYVLELARRDLARRSYAPVLGAFLARAVEGRAQRPLVDVLVSRARRHLERNREVAHEQLKHFLEEQGLLLALLASDRRVARLLEVTTETLREVEQDPAHPLRGWVDELLEGIVADLRYNPRTARDVDAKLRALVEDPSLQDLLQALLADTRASVRASLTQTDGDLADRLADLVQSAAQRVLDDPDLERRLEGRLVAAVRYLVEHYGDGAVLLIRRTVAAWDAQDASERIETAVGRDLQFIRINGTVVGALAGLGLHLIAVTFG